MTLTPEPPDPQAAKRRGRSPAGAKATLTWLAMAMLTLGSVGDLGATPATAVLGLASVWTVSTTAAARMSLVR